MNDNINMYKIAGREDLVQCRVLCPVQTLYQRMSKLHVEHIRNLLQTIWGQNASMLRSEPNPVIVQVPKWVVNGTKTERYDVNRFFRPHKVLEVHQSDEKAFTINIPGPCSDCAPAQYDITPYHQLVVLDIEHSLEPVTIGSQYMTAKSLLTSLIRDLSKAGKGKSINIQSTFFANDEGDGVPQDKASFLGAKVTMMRKHLKRLQESPRLKVVVAHG